MSLFDNAHSDRIERIMQNLCEFSRLEPEEIVSRARPSSAFWKNHLEHLFMACLDRETHARRLPLDITWCQDRAEDDTEPGGSDDDDGDDDDGEGFFCGFARVRELVPVGLTELLAMDPDGTVTAQV
jgi:hypothetical protein